MALGLTPAADCRPRDVAVTDDIRELVASLKAESAKRAADAGIRDRAIVFLAQRIASDTETFDQALTELERAVEIAIDVQKRGMRSSRKWRGSQMKTSWMRPPARWIKVSISLIRRMTRSE